MDNTNFFEIDNSSVEKAPFAIRFIFRCWHERDNGGIRFTKVQYPDFFFFADYLDYQMFWHLVKSSGIITEDLKPVTPKNVVPYFKEYARGFYFGYNNYESKIKRNTSVFNDVSSNAEQIFKTINIGKYSLCAFKATAINKKLIKTLSKELHYENGLQMGENYRAWQIIIENPQYFIDKFLNSKKFIGIYKNSIDYFKSHEMYSGILEALNSLIKSLPPEQTETKTDKLKEDLTKFGFFELPKVKVLSEPNKQNLIDLINKNDLPYNIAMFDFLGFIEYIEKEHFKSKYKLNREVSKWFNSDKDGRRVKGNISTLSRYSKEDKEKYTAHKHKETVQTDYQELK